MEGRRVADEDENSTGEIEGDSEWKRLQALWARADAASEGLKGEDLFEVLSWMLGDRCLSLGQEAEARKALALALGVPHRAPDLGNGTADQKTRALRMVKALLASGFFRTGAAAGDRSWWRGQAKGLIEPLSQIDRRFAQLEPGKVADKLRSLDRKDGAANLLAELSTLCGLDEQGWKLGTIRKAAERKR
jgi:hypothetical protein